ncbi:hypothetical protein SAMN04487934_11220 [Eubacterium ruminantium]|nr:hypothetical protein SAMN04487934_11220 [Eubacterium ruminantium]
MPNFKDLRKNKKYGESALAYAVEKVFTNNITLYMSKMSPEELGAFQDKMDEYRSMSKLFSATADVPKSRLGGLEKFTQKMESSNADKLGVELMETMKKLIEEDRDEKAKNNDPFLPIYDFYAHETTTDGNIMEARFESQYLSNLNQFAGAPDLTKDHNEIKKNLQQETDPETGEPTGLYEPLMEYYKGYIELEKMEFTRQKNNKNGWNAKNERAFLAELRDKQQKVVDAFDKLYAIEDNCQYDKYLNNELGHITGKHENRRSAFETVNVLRWQIKAIENGWSQDELTLLGAIGYIEAYHNKNEEEFNTKMERYRNTVEIHKDDWAKLEDHELEGYSDARKAVDSEASNRIKLDNFAKDVAALKAQIWDKKVVTPDDKAQVIKLVDDFAKSHTGIKLDNFTTLHHVSNGVDWNMNFIEEVKNLKPNRRKYKLYDGVKYNPPKKEDIKVEAPKEEQAVKDEWVILENDQVVAAVEEVKAPVNEENILNNAEEVKAPVNEGDAAGKAVNVQVHEAKEELSENEAGISNGYSSQGTLADKYMYAMIYKARNIRLDRMEGDGKKIEEFRDIKSYDNANEFENEFIGSLTKRFAGKSFTDKDIEPMFEKMMIAQAKAMVLTGKNFKAVHDNIDGEYKYDKALVVASEAGVFDLAEAESHIRSDVLSEEVFQNVFLAKLKYDPNMTYEQAYNNLGFTKEEQTQLQKPEVLKKKLIDMAIYKNADAEYLKDQLTRGIYDSFIKIHKARGTNKVLQNLSAEEKMLFDLGSKAFTTVMTDMLKKEKEKDKIVANWKKGEAAEKIKKVRIHFEKDQLNTMNAFLYGDKPIGITGKNELNGAYRDMLNKKTDYIGAILKDDPRAEAKASAAVNDEKLHKLLGSKNKKMGVTFGSYVKLHTGIRMGKTPDEMVDNLAKCMGAVILYNNGGMFDIGKIHEMAKKCKEIYSLDALKGNPEQLINILSNSENLTKGLNSLRDTMYNVKPDKREKYFEDLKKLADNLPTTSGHGKQYRRLNALIQEAAALKDKNLSKEELDTEIRTANVKIFNASMEYFESKGINKLDVEKNPRAVTALNAISVLTNSTEGLKYRTTKLVVDLKKSLDARHDGAAKNFEDLAKFTQKYNAANTAMQKDRVKTSPTKNKNVEAPKK